MNTERDDDQKRCCGKSSRQSCLTSSKSLGNEFKDFISKGNVFQLAIAFVMATAFAAVVTSFVNDIIMPPIGAAIGNNINNLFLVIKVGTNGYHPNGTLVSPAPIYSTLADAETFKAVTWNWGRFFSTVFYFILVALILFIIVVCAARVIQLGKMIHRKINPTSTIFDAKPDPIKCTFCQENLNDLATVCKYCGREQPIPMQSSDKVYHELQEL